MLRNYIITALRNLVRNKLYATINIVGLAVGFAAAILIALYVRDEFSYDRIFPGYQHIYLLGSEVSLPGRAKEYPDSTDAVLAPLLRNDFPTAQSTARLGAPTGLPDLTVKRGSLESTEAVTWADPNVFDIFKFKVVAGSLVDALKEPNDIVLTQRVARKYFGSDSPIGQTLEFGVSLPKGPGGPDQEELKHEVFRVTAVIADLPSNTDLDLGIIASAQNTNSPIALIEARPPSQQSYGLSSYTYLKFANAAAADQVQNGLDDFMKRHKSGVASPGNGLYVKLILRPIASLHLAPGAFGVQKPRGNLNTIYATAAIGMLIVFAAAVNFVNLVTARAARRATEVGVRKTAGAARRNLIVQFIGEALLYVIVGVMLAMILAAILLPSLNTFLDRTVEFGLLADIRWTGFVVAFSLIVGLLAGAYPAFVLSSFRPASVLKGATSQQGAPSFIRQGLVVLQFALVIGLLIATGVVYRQTRFALNEAGRLDTDQVMLVMGAPCQSAFKDGLAAIPGVRGVACSDTAALGISESLGTTTTKDGTVIMVAYHGVGFGFFGFYGLKPIAGRFFSEDHPGDILSTAGSTAAQSTVVLNEAAVRRLGFASPQDAVGRSTSMDKARAAQEIIGVVPDFAVDAVHQVVPPIVYYTQPASESVLNVRIDGARMPETLDAIDKLWKKMGSPRPISRRFLNQQIAKLYEDITRQEILFAAFAGVAISIAMLGLFGMSASIAERRTKEIGVRKAMGASSGDVVRLLVWQFTKPVILANVIAWPLGYYAMSRWLAGFAHHVTLEIWLFAAATALAILIAVLTVAGHALLVARAKPVTALRYE